MAQEAAADGLHWVHGELRWHRAQSHRALAIALVLAALLAASLACNLLLWLDAPAPKYFAATPDLRLALLTPLDRPLMSRSALLNWASAAVVRTLSLDFVHWRQQLAAVRSDYTRSAFDQLLDALKASGDLALVRRRRLAVAVALDGAPVLTREGVLDGVRAWQLQFPLTLSYESAAGVEDTQRLIAAVVVTRVDQRSEPRGIAIAQLVLSLGSSP